MQAVAGSEPAAPHAPNEMPKPWAGAHRASDRALIGPHMDARMGDNICGPSVLRVPDWVAAPLGRYYCYFADHRGRYIRLAFADRPEGPWQMHGPGALDLSETPFVQETPVITEAPAYWSYWGDGSDGWRQYLYPHIASPDVHAVEEDRQIRMYLHGLMADGDQRTRVAVSDDGLHFRCLPQILAPAYLRTFRWDGAWYGLASDRVLLRSPDGLANFETGHFLLPEMTRHVGLAREGHLLHLLWTEFEEVPEQIHYGWIDLRGDWREWTLTHGDWRMTPVSAWEGAGEPLKAGVSGAADALEHALRDPFPFFDQGRRFLFYVGGGERGIGLAEAVF